MGYIVLARKYRPQSFEDFVGQEPIAMTLRNAITSDRVGHAYLFCGPRGVGKTSMARVLAKALNCTTGPTPTPCNQCDPCTRIGAGNDMDVLEIDGASNRGIDEVREIRQNAQYVPSRSNFKIYIIDEVHMLTVPAFNALLKTLEEPPAHVKFIFATTAPTRLPETIRSRCQRFDFRRIAAHAIAERLRRIVKKEKVRASKEALLAIARCARGSMRDGLSLLDQIISFCSGRIGAKEVAEVVGAASDEEVARLVDAFVAKDPAAALRIGGGLLDKGKDVGDLLMQVAMHLRDLLVAAHCGPDKELLNQTQEGAKALAERSRLLSPDTLLYMLQVLSEARLRARDNVHDRIVLETALLKLARMEDLTTLDEMAKRLAAATAGTRQAARPPREYAPAPARGPSGSPRPREASVSERRSSYPPAPDGRSGPPQRDASEAPASIQESTRADDVWSRVLEHVRASNLLLHSQIRGARLARFDDEEAVIVLRTTNSAALKMVNEPDNVQALQSIFNSVTGKRPRIRARVEPEAPAQEAPAIDDAAVTPPPDGAAPDGADRAPPPSESPAQALERLRQEEMVLKTVEVFDGSIVSGEGRQPNGGT